MRANLPVKTLIIEQITQLSLIAYTNSGSCKKDYGSLLLEGAMYILLKNDILTLDKQILNLVTNWLQLVVHGNLNLKPKLVPTAIDADFRLSTFRDVFLKTSGLLLSYLNFGGEDGFNC
jgi:hypothetical protein